jgi:hypothetical protein
MKKCILLSLLVSGFVYCKCQDMTPAVTKAVDRSDHFSSWSADGGASNITGWQSNYFYGPYFRDYNGAFAGIARHWGVQTSRYTSFSIGAEFHSYNGKIVENDQYPPDRIEDQIHLLTVGMPLSFTFADTQRSGLYADVTLSPGARFTFEKLYTAYDGQTVESNEAMLKVMGTASFSAGYSLKMKHATIRFGPYVSYSVTSQHKSNIGNMQCFGLSVAIVTRHR